MSSCTHTETQFSNVFIEFRMFISLIPIEFSNKLSKEEIKRKKIRFLSIYRAKNRKGDILLKKSHWNWIENL